MAETRFDVLDDNIEADRFYIVSLHDLEEEDGYCVVDLEEDGSCVDLHNIEEDEYSYCVVDLEDVDVEDDGNRVIWGSNMMCGNPGHMNCESGRLLEKLIARKHGRLMEKLITRS
jgi:hypothetical protein